MRSYYKDGTLAKSLIKFVFLGRMGRRRSETRGAAARAGESGRERARASEREAWVRFYARSNPGLDSTLFQGCDLTFEFPEKKTCTSISCLLYTSPSPRD